MGTGNVKKMECKVNFGKKKEKKSDLDDRHHIASRVLEFAHVDGEMFELVFLRLFEDKPGALSDGIDAS